MLGDHPDRAADVFALLRQVTGHELRGDECLRRFPKMIIPTWPCRVDKRSASTPHDGRWMRRIAPYLPYGIGL